MEKHLIIHCKTQEEWDAVTKKLNIKWKHAEWRDYKENSAIDTLTHMYSPLNYYEQKGNCKIVEASIYLTAKYKELQPLIYN